MALFANVGFLYRLLLNPAAAEEAEAEEASAEENDGAGLGNCWVN